MECFHEPGSIQELLVFTDLGTGHYMSVEGRTQ